VPTVNYLTRADVALLFVAIGCESLHGKKLILASKEKASGIFKNLRVKLAKRFSFEV